MLRISNVWNIMHSNLNTDIFLSVPRQRSKKYIYRYTRWYMKYTQNICFTCNCMQIKIYEIPWATNSYFHSWKKHFFYLINFALFVFHLEKNYSKYLFIIVYERETLKKIVKLIKLSPHAKYWKIFSKKLIFQIFFIFLAKMCMKIVEISK